MSTKLFAIPTIEEKLCAHFGHCEKFAIVKVEDDKIVNEEFVSPPEHQPGTYPRFLAEKGVSTIISGGMGQKAQDIFAHNNIEVFMGIGSEEPKILVENYLNNQLQAGNNLCDH
ncbi:MAG: NifB/NifX family molybdenum-iron cluster-binding protein [Bacteroidota bacterium]